MSDYDVVATGTLPAADLNSRKAGTLDQQRRLRTVGTIVGEDGGAPAVRSASYTPMGYQQLSNATLAVSTPLTVPAGATVAIIQNNGTQPARFRDDGVAPTATTGQRIAAGEFYTYDGNLSAMRLIREADGVTLDIAYYS
jgi:hypothetical protein